MGSSGKAPGVNERGNVRTTMDNANKVSTTAAGNGMSEPFGQGRSGGDGGSNIPTHVYDRSLGSPKVPAPSQGSVYGAQGGQKRPGTK